MGVSENLHRVTRRVAAAARRAGREPGQVTVVAVSKRHPAKAIAGASKAGLRDFGENYAQELAQKAEVVGDEPDLRWHFVGHLQRNKVKLVVGTAALIHAVDSERLAEAIHRHAEARGIVQPILVAVNVGGEGQKSGVAPVDAESLVHTCAKLSHVDLRGLMTMPPFADEPEHSRPHFAALRDLRDLLASKNAPLPELSMGTTGDFEVAIEEGATLVRIGTAIFGPRPTPGAAVR